MVAVLPLSFSFRTDHYDLLLENRVLGITPEFQAKVGHIIGQLYSRIGTPDLHDYGWNDKKTRQFINLLLSNSNLQQVPDIQYIQYIKENMNDTVTDIDALIEEYEALKIKKSLQPLLKNIKTHLIRLFEDQQKIHSLLASATDKKILSKEINQLLEDAITGD